MLKKLFFVIIFLSASLLAAQQKYFVYFKDKGTHFPNRLYKTADIESLCTPHLSDKAIERRKKVLGEKNYVGYDDIPVYQIYKDQITSLGIEIKNTLNWFNAVSCYLTAEQYSKVQSYSFVEKIEPVRTIVLKEYNEMNFEDYRGTLPAVNALMGFNYGASYTQDNLENIPTVHNAGYSGNGVIVGILDGGFEHATNPSLIPVKVLAEHDFVFNDDITSDQPNDQPGAQDHGTGVLSIMAGYAPGYIIGPAYGASFLLAKTEDVRTEKNIEEDNYAAGLEWMEARGVQITSSSLGYTTFDAGQTSYTYADMNGKTTIVTKAAEKAFSNGVLTITAAGNEGSSAWYYISAPADGFNTLAVGAVNSDNTLATFSSRGPTSDGRIKPDIVAQGTNVYHAIVTPPYYASGDGTSYATPITSGIAALLLEAYPHLTNVQARNILQLSGDNVSTPNNNRGYGLVSAVRALNFPNVKNNSGTYILNKMFLGQTVVSNAVKINYVINYGVPVKINMSYDGTNKYTATLPALSTGDVIRFNFIYSTSSGGDPSSQVYSIAYGDINVRNSAFLAGTDEEGQLPDSFVLYQNYPNPFNLGTTIKFDLTVSSQVSADIYNVLGQKITTVYSGVMSAGKGKSLYWSGKDDKGAACPSGVYIFSLHAGDMFAVKKMVLLK